LSSLPSFASLLRPALSSCSGGEEPDKRSFTKKKKLDMTASLLRGSTPHLRNCSTSASGVVIGGCTRLCVSVVSSSVLFPCSFHSYRCNLAAFERGLLRSEEIFNPRRASVPFLSIIIIPCTTTNVSGASDAVTRPLLPHLSRGAGPHPRSARRQGVVKQRRYVTVLD
jgi:hypothetical protein